MMEKIFSKRAINKNIVIYLLLRIFVIISLISQLIKGNWNNAFLCVITLLLFTLPTIVSQKMHMILPNALEITVYFFIYAAEILGEIQNFYGIFPYWDSLLHTLNGFLCASIGFSMIDILNNNDTFHIHMTPIFVSLVAFTFSMTIGVIWEFGEFTIDYYLDKDMQKDRIINQVSSIKLSKTNQSNKITNIDETIIYSNNREVITIINGGYLDIGLIDTMKDLFVNSLGAIVFSIIGYFYIKNREGYQFIEKFIPKLKR